MSNAAAPKPGSFEEARARINLVPTIMRGKADLQEAALIVLNARSELKITGKLLTTTALAPFGYEEVVIRHEEQDDRSAGELVVPKLSTEAMIGEQGPSGSGKNKDDEEQEN